MGGEKILIVDDEKVINDLIRSYLDKEGFTSRSAYDGKTAVEMVKAEEPELIILDVMLPDSDGTSVCLELRKITNAPILFLSCKAEEIDKIVALSAGGDDYITKPFLPGELIARVKAHLRRQKKYEKQGGLPEPTEKVYKFPGLTINTNVREIMSNGVPVNLTAKEYEILMLLVENQKRVFSAEQIFELTWKTKCLAGDSRTVMVYISTIRKKLEVSSKQPMYILSIRGLGYKFNHKLVDGEENGEDQPTNREQYGF